MKVIYLAVQAISFLMVSIGKGVAFLYWGLPYRIILQITRFSFWEQRILWGLLIPIYFFVVHVPLSWWVISSYQKDFGLILGLIGYWIVGITVQCIGLADGYFDRDDDRQKYIPSDKVKWYNFKEELANKKAEAARKEEERKAAIEAEREKDPDYVEAARNLGILPKPKAVFYEHPRDEWAAAEIQRVQNEILEEKLKRVEEKVKRKIDVSNRKV